MRLSAKDLEHARAALHSGIARLESAGFVVGERPSLSVEPNLKIMGYTRGPAGQREIVIAGRALRFGVVDTLVMHELSHIVMSNIGHPSHNDRLIISVLHRYHRKLAEWKISILADGVNHVQNVYTDDVLAKALSKKQTKDTRSFFYSWLKTVYPRGRTAEQDKWSAVAVVLNNAFAVASLRRRRMLKPLAFEKKMFAKNGKFLKSAGLDEKTFGWFADFFTNLPKKTTRVGYRKLLIAFLDKVVEVTED